jgi:hypothetical protein
LSAVYSAQPAKGHGAVDQIRYLHQNANQACGIITTILESEIKKGGIREEVDAAYHCRLVQGGGRTNL